MPLASKTDKISFWGTLRDLTVVEASQKENKKFSTDKDFKYFFHIFFDFYRKIKQDKYLLSTKLKNSKGKKKFSFKWNIFWENCDVKNNRFHWNT